MKPRRDSKFERLENRRMAAADVYGPVQPPSSAPPPDWEDAGWVVGSPSATGLNGLASTDSTLIDDAIDQDYGPQLPDAQRADRLANALAAQAWLSGVAESVRDSGALFFGAHWCGNCRDQKAAFGSAADLLPYVEASGPDGLPNAIGIEHQITVYPTWRFPGEFRLVAEAYFNATSSVGKSPHVNDVFQEERYFEVHGTLQPLQLAALVGHSQATGVATVDRPGRGEPQSNPDRNPRFSFDVNDNGIASALDALLIINALSRGDTSSPNGQFLDVSGDGTISALDALLVINFLNTQDREEPFRITGPRGNLTTVGDQKITWTRAVIGSSVTYDVALATAASCDANTFVAIRKGITGLETSFFQDIAELEDGEYFICLTANGFNGSRVPAENQGVAISLELERFHTAFFSQDTVPIPDGLIDPATNTNIEFFDQKCTEFASRAGLIEDWDGESLLYTAIMSDDFTDVRTRLNVRAKVLNTVGATIADGDLDLFDGSIQRGLSRDEFGVLDFDRAAGYYSGSNDNGTRVIGGTCDSWTTPTGESFLILGFGGAISGAWISSSPTRCRNNRRISCMSNLMVR